MPRCSQLCSFSCLPANTKRMAVEGAAAEGHHAGSSVSYEVPDCTAAAEWSSWMQAGCEKQGGRQSQ